MTEKTGDNPNQKPKPGQGNQSISSREVRRMDDITKKDKWWIYLIFFSIGIVSFIISVVLGRIFLLPLLICSILFAIAMYKFKKKSFNFALMAFAIIRMTQQEEKVRVIDKWH